jgi:hypothetical protein
MRRAKKVDSLLDAVSTTSPGLEPSDQCSRRCRLGYRLDLRQLLSERARSTFASVLTPN